MALSGKFHFTYSVEQKLLSIRYILTQSERLGVLVSSSIGLADQVGMLALPLKVL